MQKPVETLFRRWMARIGIASVLFFVVCLIVVQLALRHEEQRLADARREELRAEERERAEAAAAAATFWDKPASAAQP